MERSYASIKQIYSLKYFVTSQNLPHMQETPRYLQISECVVCSALSFPHLYTILISLSKISFPTSTFLLLATYVATFSVLFNLLFSCTYSIKSPSIPRMMLSLGLPELLGLKSVVVLVLTFPLEFTFLRTETLSCVWEQLLKKQSDED